LTSRLRKSESLGRETDMAEETGQAAVDAYTETMKERRQYLRATIEILEGSPRLSLSRKLALFALAAKLADEAFAQADLTMELNGKLVAICQGLQAENAKLADQNEFLLTSLMDGKTFQFKKA